MMTTTADRALVSGLPRIVRFLGVDDAPGSSCPHCGATGRFIYRFQVQNGRELGAMRGCVQLFPVSPIAREHARLIKKSADYTARGWKLNRDDAMALDAIEAFCEGQLDEHSALSAIGSAKQANALRARNRGRR